MNSKRIYYVMIAVIVVLLGAIVGGTYLANQQLVAQSGKLLGYKTQDQVLAQEQQGLAKAKKDVAKYGELEKIAKTIVPQDKDQANVVREIVKIAAESGIKPTAINLPASTLGAATGAAGSTTSTTTTNSAAANAKAALSQLTPVKGMPGVYSLEITVQQDASAPVPYSRFLDFLSRLEKNRRTSQVSGIVLQPSSLDRNLVSFTLTVNEYIKP